MASIRRILATFGPQPEGWPETYTPREVEAYSSGWWAASDNWSINGNPYKDRARMDAWDCGHRAYYSWLAEHRIRACDRDEQTREAA